MKRGANFWDRASGFISPLKRLNSRETIREPLACSVRSAFEEGTNGGERAGREGFCAVCDQ